MCRHPDHHPHCNCADHEHFHPEDHPHGGHGHHQHHEFAGFQGPPEYGREPPPPPHGSHAHGPDHHGRGREDFRGGHEGRSGRGGECGHEHGPREEGRHVPGRHGHGEPHGMPDHGLDFHDGGDRPGGPDDAERARLHYERLADEVVNEVIRERAKAVIERRLGPKFDELLELVVDQMLKRIRQGFEAGREAEEYRRRWEETLIGEKK